MATKNWRFWAIWSPLVLLALIGLFNHELWLDEMHNWLLSRDSATLTELARNARFESHPLLWNGLLWILSRFTWNPLSMQILHGLLVLVIYALWVRFAPFPWYVLILAGLGYFMFYEYAALSRNYALGVLGLFIAASAIRKPQPKLAWITFGCLLAILSHLLFIIPAAVLFIFSWIRYGGKWPLKRRVFYFILFMFFLIPAIYWCIPDSAHRYLKLNETGLFSWPRIEAALHYLSEAIIPIPDMSQQNWWNSHWLENKINDKLIFALIGVALFGLLVFSLRKDRLAMGFFVISVLGILVFAWLSEMRAVRYTGPVWISYLVAWWIAKAPFRLNWRGGVFVTLSVVQMIAAALAWNAELHQPFSEDKAAAQYIQENDMAGVPIYSFPECAALVTVGYLEKSSACYPQTGRCGSFCIWPKIPRNQDVHIFWNNLQHELPTRKGPLLILLNKPLPPELESQVVPLQAFTKSQVSFGQVYLYLLNN